MHVRRVFVCFCVCIPYFCLSGYVRVIFIMQFLSSVHTSPRDTCGESLGIHSIVLLLVSPSV